MTPSWRTLEREIVSILEMHRFDIKRQDGETSLHVTDWDFPFTFSLTTFAKDLAKRLESAR
jgi:hypothetical protein